MRQNHTFRPRFPSRADSLPLGPEALSRSEVSSGGARPQRRQPSRREWATWLPLTLVALLTGCATLEDPRDPPPPLCAADEPALNSVQDPAVRVAARYPRVALRTGKTGFVCMNFTVQQAGEVSEICVADAMPERLFDRAAGEALAQWRFDAPERPFRSGTCMMFDVR